MMMNNPIFNMSMIQQFNKFKNEFTGDPRQQVQNMMNSGQLSQEQYNKAVQTANMLSNILK